MTQSKTCASLYKKALNPAIFILLSFLTLCVGAKNSQSSILDVESRFINPFFAGYTKIVDGKPISDKNGVISLKAYVYAHPQKDSFRVIVYSPINKDAIAVSASKLFFDQEAFWQALRDGYQKQSNKHQGNFLTIHSLSAQAQIIMNNAYYAFIAKVKKI